MNKELQNLLIEGAEAFSESINEEQIEKFVLYMDLLKEWNGRFNLTAIEDDRDVIVKHFIDSLSILPYIKKGKKENNSNDCKRDSNSRFDDKGNDLDDNLYVGSKLSLIDIGSGAGFPGIPVKILRDDISVTLVDSLEKRVKFLKEVTARLDLKGMSSLHGRAEDFGMNPKYRERFDICTARAVANLPVLLEYCLPFVKIGGIFIAMKTSNNEEMENSKKALEILGGEIEKINDITLPSSSIKRSIIVVGKKRATPAQYPRKAGKASKGPII
ncbi:MAG: 16S rRNA (guanine(527)-N(7))-methyltransferase RsmG [Clostridia bacterium]|jgi:16S rRNA (guanine527-N7)-methyltransferase